MVGLQTAKCMIHVPPHLPILSSPLFLSLPPSLPLSLPPFPLSLSLSSGEAAVRRTIILFADPALHRLLWQRPEQSDLWNLDDVTLLVEECLMGVGGCEGGRVRVDFNGTVK